MIDMHMFGGCSLELPGCRYAVTSYATRKQMEMSLKIDVLLIFNKRGLPL